MNKRYWIILVAVAVISFMMGFAVKFIITEPEIKEIDNAQTVIVESQEESIEIEIRIREGYVEWYDGEIWNRVKPVEELQGEDIFQLAQDDLKEFEAEYLIKLETEEDSTVTETTDVMSEPLIGSVPKPATTSVPDNQAAVDEESVSQTTAPASSSGGSSGGGSTSTPQPSTPPTETAPSTPSEPEVSVPSTPTEPETPSASDTGDGEDIGWSDDYL